MGRRGRKAKAYKGRDRFGDQAAAEGYVARSVCKLQEIQRRCRVLKQGQRVVDLGCSPGSWLQYAGRVVGRRGRVVGVDLAPVVAEGPVVLQRSVFSVDADELIALLGGRPDVVLSDMAPRTTGNTLGDHVRQVELAQRAAELALELLEPGGCFVCKVFDGEEAHGFVQSLRPSFERTRRVRPEAVRANSREFFVVCSGRRPPAPPTPPELPPSA